MFQPFNGMAAEPTQTNVQKALDGELEISIPWIESAKGNNGIPPTSEAHPISASAQHLCLFDRSHERNAKRKEEALRRVTNIEELKLESLTPRKTTSFTRRTIMTGGT